ncbi:MAG: CBS domain-containing protein, partial [bacterium]
MVLNKNPESILIHKDETVKTALKKLDKSAQKVLVVVDSEKHLLGTISDGDIRRYILRGDSLDNNIEGVYNTKCTSFKEETFVESEARKIFAEKKIELVPLLDQDNRVVSYLTWGELLGTQNSCEGRRSKGKIDTPVVIMAGGKGTRLEPFTNIFPKALIPIGDKTILELIIDGFNVFGVDQFY